MVPDIGNSDTQNFITPAIEEAFSQVPFHYDVSFKRLLYLGKTLNPDAKLHVAVHIINSIPKDFQEYCKPHKHDVDEINLLISENGKLQGEIILDNKIRKVTAPSSIYIPGGTLHSFKPLKGEGILVCIIMSNDYKSFV